MKVKELQQQVLDVLDSDPMHFDKLAKKLGVSNNESKRLSLVRTVSRMEQSTRPGAHPLLKSALPVELQSRIVYPIYRVDQEAEMIAKGKLGSEVETDLGKIISEETLKKFLNSDF